MISLASGESYQWDLTAKDRHARRLSPLDADVTDNRGANLWSGPPQHWNILQYFSGSSTYDHRTLKIRLPVRSAIYKQCTGGLVVRWVTTSESPLLYVFLHLIDT
jgi:hypothetical protein